MERMRIPLLSLMIFLAVFVFAVTSHAYEEVYEGVVDRVLDGDTLEINGKRVRLLGVDAPERWWWGRPHHCYSQESAEYLQRMVSGKMVRVTYDKGHRYHDRRGVRRVYVYLNGRSVNADMIRNGYAFADRSRHYRDREYFEMLMADAKLNDLGLWRVCPVECYHETKCKTQDW